MDLEFYTPEEVAEIFKIAKVQVYYWLKKGRMRGLRIGEGKKARWRIPKTEVSRMHAKIYEDEDV